MERVAKEEAVQIAENILFLTKNVDIVVPHMSKLWNGIKKAIEATGKGAVYLGKGYANKVKKRLWTISDFEDMYYDLIILHFATLIDKKRMNQNL